MQAEQNRWLHFVMILSFNRVEHTLQFTIFLNASLSASSPASVLRSFLPERTASALSALVFSVFRASRCLALSASTADISFFYAVSSDLNESAVIPIVLISVDRDATCSLSCCTSTLYESLSFKAFSKSTSIVSTRFFHS